MMWVIAIASWFVCLAIAVLMAQATGKFGVGIAGLLGFLLGPLGVILVAFKCLPVGYAIPVAVAAAGAGFGLLWWQASTYGSVVDADKVEQQIAFDLAQQGYSDAIVDCPEGKPWEGGDTFTCTAMAKGEAAVVTVLMSDDGTYQWVARR